MQYIPSSSAQYVFRLSAKQQQMINNQQHMQHIKHSSNPQTTIRMITQISIPGLSLSVPDNSTSTLKGYSSLGSLIPAPFLAMTQNTYEASAEKLVKLYDSSVTMADCSRLRSLLRLSSPSALQAIRQSSIGLNLVSFEFQVMRISRPSEVNSGLFKTTGFGSYPAQESERERERERKRERFL